MIRLATCSVVGWAIRLLCARVASPRTDCSTERAGPIQSSGVLAPAGQLWSTARSNGRLVVSTGVVLRLNRHL